MLKNELEILTDIFTQRSEGYDLENKKSKSNFNKIVVESCSRARSAWATATFSDINNEGMSRYFNFHFSFVNGLIAEKSQSGFRSGQCELFGLIDHLLLFYRKFIDLRQPVAREYVDYRLQILQSKYQQFIEQFTLHNCDEEFKLCIAESLTPIIQLPTIESIELGSLLYREELIMELAGKRNCPVLLANDNLISTLISFNFNHARFLRYLRKRALSGISKISQNDYSKYFAELSLEIPVADTKEDFCFDSKWPHIREMYNDWLNDYGALLALTFHSQVGSSTITKIPLNMSVKQLGCMIRTLYQSGFYGNVSLTAIFDHAATVFTSKRQEQISAESISNAYYGISQSSALKISRLFGNGIDFLKPYCFPE